MKYAEAQAEIQTRLQAVWTYTALQFENQPFKTDLYEEYTRATIQFGDAFLRSLGARCMRVPGILFLDFFVRPGVGSHRLAQLANLANGFFIGQSLGTDPVINFLEPSLSKDFAERTGWVSAQLRITFYFDTEV